MCCIKLHFLLDENMDDAKRNNDNEGKHYDSKRSNDTEEKRDENYNQYDFTGK